MKSVGLLFTTGLCCLLTTVSCEGRVSVSGATATVVIKQHSTQWRHKRWGINLTLHPHLHLQEKPDQGQRGRPQSDICWHGSLSTSKGCVLSQRRFPHSEPVHTQLSWRPVSTWPMQRYDLRTINGSGGKSCNRREISLILFRNNLDVWWTWSMSLINYTTLPKTNSHYANIVILSQ